MRIKRTLEFFDAGNGPSSFTTVFTPGYLFTSGAQGAWYDPSDFSTLYQDANGTTPVTAVEQPVRLMLDRSKGLVLGPELAPAISALTATVDNSGSAVSTFSNGVWSITGASTIMGYPRLQLNVPGIVIGRRYLVAFSATWTGGTVTGAYVRLAIGGSANDVGTLTVSGNALTARQTAAATNMIEIVPVPINATNTGTITITSLSIRELPGNHATAPNDASRPVLRARYNLLTFSEQFNNAVWQKNDGSSVTANAVVAPDGTTTADQIDLSASELSRVQQPLSGQPTASYTFTVWLRVASGSVSVRFGSSADLDVITVTDTWQRFTSTKTVTTPTQPNLTIRNEAGGGAKTLYAWGAQILTAADQTATGGAYQRVGAATDYDTSNPVWRPYLAFDGSDDSFSTSSIDFSGTDEMTVFAGVTKLSDAARAMVAELGNNVSSSFRLEAPNTTLPIYHFASAGSSLVGISTSSVYAAPTTNVVTGVADISADVVTVRVNGAQAATSSGDQGTGNYANAALFIGRRNNTSLPFNGRIYSLIVLGRTATTAELTSTETWVNGKTGAF